VVRVTRVRRAPDEIDFELPELHEANAPRALLDV
jgi:hypothetical protein